MGSSADSSEGSIGGEALASFACFESASLALKYGNVLGSGQEILEPELQIAATQCQPLSLRTEFYGMVADATAFRPTQECAGSYLPQDHGAAKTSRREKLPIRAEGEGGNAIAMS